MIKIKQAVIVEGKYDKIRLSSMLDALIIETGGFSVFKDTEKQKLIRDLANKRGLLILTDSDSAGFMIRSFISGTVPKEKIIHAYIPDIFGKEKRKTEHSKEGKLGVEGMPTEVLMETLEKAGVFCEYTENPSRQITNADLYEDGFSGKDGAQERKKALLKYFSLPERLSKNSLLKVLNTFATYDEYKQAVKAVNEINEK